MEVSDHLFRHEAGRMVATLTRIFGVHNVALAEDVVQDAFCRAMEVWSVRGVPENPSAWLVATAKHRALDVLRRQRTARITKAIRSKLWKIRRASVEIAVVVLLTGQMSPHKLPSMAHYPALIGKRVRALYRAGGLYLTACGSLVGESVRSVFIEERFSRNGKEKMFRIEIPHRCLLRIAESKPPSNPLDAVAPGSKP